MPRPRSVTFLALMVLSLAAFNAWGVVQGVTRYTWLTELPLSLPPAYLVGRSLVWAVAFAALAVGLWRLREWARVGTLAGFTLYLAQGWAERLLFGQTEYLRQTM